MFSLLLGFRYSYPDDFPLLKTSCDNTSEEFNSVFFECREPSKCVTDGKIYNKDGTETTVADCTAAGNVVSCRRCIEKTEYDNVYNLLINSVNDAPFFINVPGNFGSLRGNLSEEYISELKTAATDYYFNKDSEEAVQRISNLCALSHYTKENAPCNQIFNNTAQILNYHNYRFWPQDQVFLEYNGVKSDILKEEVFKSTFNKDRKVSIQLARYTRDGKFIGFHKLTNDFEKCNVEYKDLGRWMNYGSNLYSKCNIDLWAELQDETTDFFEPFIEDNENGSTVIRPIPVVDKQFTNILGGNLNSNNDHLFRRFFIMDNYSTTNVIQHLEGITLEFDQRTDVNTINNPLLILNYVQHLRTNVVENQPTIGPYKESLSTPKYEFKVTYTQSLSKFWDAIVIVFVVFAILIVFYIAFRLFTFIAKHNGDGVSTYVILGSIRIVLDAISVLLFGTVLVISIYYWFFYKLQDTLTTFLPPGEEFPLLTEFLWSAVAIKAVATAIHLYLKTTGDVFLVDWETPRADEHPVSAWRRITVASEWNNVQTVRAYSVGFTAVLLAFILTGFGVDRLAAPIPDAVLADVGISSRILRVGWNCIVLIAAALIQYLFCELIYWRFGGDPFLNLVDLCSTSNVSFLMMETWQHGFYVHGRCPSPHADEPMHRLNANMAAEALGVAGGRGLEAGDTAQTFEFFCEASFRRALGDTYQSVAAQTGHSVLRQAAASVPQACITTFRDVNKALTHFFDMSQSEYRVEKLSEPRFPQRFLGIPPETAETSVLMRVGDRAFRKTMLYGIQWSLYLFYMMLYVAIDMHTKSPVIAGFVVFIIDALVVILFKMAGKANLARKALLDNRFLAN